MKTIQGRPARFLSMVIPFVAVMLFGASGSWAQVKTLKEQLVGTWDAVSISIEQSDGSKSDPYSGKLKGRSIYTTDGYFFQHNTRTDVPKFSAGNRTQGTADENQAAVRGSYALFGTYTVDEAGETITVRIAASSFSNEIGAEIKRPFTISGNELRYVNPAPTVGGTGAVNILKRAI